MSTNNSWNNRISAANSSITLNSSINTVGISTDASATTVNIATGAAAKTIAVGSTNSTSALTLNSGSGGIIASGVSGVSVANKNYMSINTSTGALGSDTGPSASMILIQTQTASVSTNVNFTTGISGTYGAYMVFIRPLSAAGNPDVQMLFSTNGGSTYLSSTYTAGYNSTAWNSTTWANVNSTSLCPLTSISFGVFPIGAIDGYIYLCNLGSSGTTTYTGRFFSGNVQYVSSGACTTGSINAIRFQLSTGTITAATISLYGILG